MDDIALTPLEQSDTPALMRFETENRGWFEAWVPPRPEGYWQRDSLEAIIRDQVAGAHAMFLIRLGPRIAGRLDLTDFAGGTAGLGTRIGRDHCAQGIATRAVRLGLDAARALHLDAVEARTKHDNPASARVLEKTGFSAITSDRGFRFFRQTLDTA